MLRISLARSGKFDCLTLNLLHPKTKNEFPLNFQISEELCGGQGQTESVSLLSIEEVFQGRHEKRGSTKWEGQDKLSQAEHRRQQHIEWAFR